MVILNIFLQTVIKLHCANACPRTDIHLSWWYTHRVWSPPDSVSEWTSKYVINHPPIHPILDPPRFLYHSVIDASAAADGQGDNDIVSTFANDNNE